jgi:hypothetical protein
MKMGTPSDTQTLSQLGSALGGQVQTYKALAGENLGHMTLKLSLSLRQFTEISWVANKVNNTQNAQFENEAVAQRTLIPTHVKGLAQYTLMGLVNAQFQVMKKEGVNVNDVVKKLITYLPSGPYASLQPITCNIRSCEFGGGGINYKDVLDRYDNPTGVYDVSLSQKDILYVVDGQHRRAGFDQVLSFLKDVTRTYKYPKKGLFVPPNYNDQLITESEHSFWQNVLELALSKSTISVEVHLGLNADQEQQMFVDLNAKSKNVQTSFVNSFDHADPINKFINSILIDEEIVSFGLSDEDQSDWHKDSGDLKRKDIKQICSLLLLGKTSSITATPVLIEERADFGRKFWETVCTVPGFGKEGARSLTVLQQPVVLKALAKMSFDLGYGTAKIKNTDDLKTLFRAVADGTLKFTHDEPIWRSLLMSVSEREIEFPGISEFIHVPRGTNLDAGTWDEDNGWLRYGSRHNDIFPRLSDAIRFQLGFEPRLTVSNSIAVEKAAIAAEVAEANAVKEEADVEAEETTA